MSGGQPNILHLAPDEKFIPFVRKSFEAAFPGHNRFRVTVAPPGPRFVALSEDVKVARARYWFGRELESDLAWCDCLVVHYLSPWFAHAIRKVPPSVLLVWGSWGGDIYDLLPGLSGALLLPQTRALVARLEQRRKESPGQALERIRQALCRAFLPRWRPRLIGRFDVVSTIIPAEYELLAASLPELRARRHQIHYGSAEDTFMKGPDRLRGRDILVGNSATPTNNHLEAFALLRRMDLAGRRLVVPLSYGYGDYADEVCKAGERLFGADFVPLRRLLPLDEYNAAIAGCGTLVMNHVRQQATGNINTGLYKGAKVFLRRENPLRDYYRALGIRVFELPLDESADASFFDTLPEAEIANTRSILASRFAFARAVDAARGLAEMVAAKRGGGLRP